MGLVDALRKIVAKHPISFFQGILPFSLSLHLPDLCTFFDSYSNCYSFIATGVQDCLKTIIIYGGTKRVFNSLDNLFFMIEKLLYPAYQEVAESIGRDNKNEEEEDNGDEELTTTNNSYQLLQSLRKSLKYLWLLIEQMLTQAKVTFIPLLIYLSLSINNSLFIPPHLFTIHI